MKYSDAINILKQKQLKSVYLIMGEELYLAEKYLKTLLAIINPNNDQESLHYFNTTTNIRDITESLDSSPFFSERNIIICKDLKIFQDKLSSKDKEDEQYFLEYLPTIPEYSILILQYTQGKLDKRRKLIKTIDKLGVVVECEPIAHWNIGEWLNTRLRELNLRFDREAYAYFLEAIKSMDKISLGFLDQELQKLTLYPKSSKSPTQTQFIISRKFLEDNFASIPEISTFRLWEAIGDKNIALALELFITQQQAGVHPLRLLKFLVRQVDQLWHVKIYLQERQSVKQIATTLKLHPFITEKIIKQAQHFSLATIEQMISDLAEADYKLKTGSNEPALIENILIKFCA